MDIPEARNLPFEEKYTKCTSCFNQANCRIFFKLPHITSARFLCYDCFLTKRATEDYQPLLLSTSLGQLTQSLEKEKLEKDREWYNQTELLKMPARAGEKTNE